ncbi:hypothetical protein [Pseudomonas syringae group genomosp. 7]|uniref:hypothetical protein n=1 Tax=Pseudomonas syringae group genomosp. 7 TaxID=251699 RepID=UPI00376FAF85
MLIDEEFVVVLGGGFTVNFCVLGFGWGVVWVLVVVVLWGVFWWCFFGFGCCLECGLLVFWFGGWFCFGCLWLWLWGGVCWGFVVCGGVFGGRWLSV